jgi:phenylalanyl-tRNA synthetase beta chain
MVVISDADGPTSIAGVMGGARSEVRPGHEARAAGGGDLERPEHSPHLVEPRPAQRGLGSRFEKGLAPEQCLHAQAVATKLLIELCGAKVAPGTIDDRLGRSA